MGYHRAGFEVVGVDIKPQPHYPFEFWQADALDWLAVREVRDDFEAIHASPPCQGYTTMANKHPERQAEWPRLIGPVRNLLMPTGLPYVIENVEGAASEMRSTLRLHGGLFGLGVHRPRLFESNVLMLLSRGPRAVDPMGVYGKLDGRRLWTRADGSEIRNARTIEDARRVMGIDWMDWDEIREAIPPAYTEWIGKQLMEALKVAA